MSDNDRKIDYDALTKDALRDVVKNVLRDIEKNGLPGEHHLFISFDTEAEGVVMSKRLREQYPHEMTIVLQHRFWDLEVHGDRFQVKLTFDAIPERLSIPYKALKVFYDPSVPYGLQFAVSDITTDAMRRPSVLGDANMHVDEGHNAPTVEDFMGGRDGHNGEERPAQIAEVARDKPNTATNDATGGDADDDADAEAGAGADDAGDKTGSAEIVELDSFRKR